MAWHCGNDWNNEGLNLGSGRLGQALIFLLELCFLTLRVAIWRSPRGRLKTTLHTQDLEVSELAEPSSWENGGLLSESLQIQSDLPLLWIWASGWEAQKGWAQGLINRYCRAWPSGVTCESWGHGSRAPGDSCKRKGVLAMLKHPSTCIMSTDCIIGEDGTCREGCAQGRSYELCR